MRACWLERVNSLTGAICAMCCVSFLCPIWRIERGESWILCVRAYLALVHHLLAMFPIELFSLVHAIDFLARSFLLVAHKSYEFLSIEKLIRNADKIKISLNALIMRNWSISSMYQILIEWISTSCAFLLIRGIPHRKCKRNSQSSVISDKHSYCFYILF